jgi:hypothetical protein
MCMHIILLLVILCYRVSCCIVLQRHVLETFHAVTVKSHASYRVGYELCMKMVLDVHEVAVSSL